MININNLTVYTFRNKNKVYLLNDISFYLNKGECLGIIGKTGAGKSTLAKALLGIYENNVFLESGEILIEGKKFASSQRGKDIAILFQNPNTYLNPLMKVGKQIEEMFTYHFKDSKKIAKQKALDLMRKVKINDPLTIYNYLPHEISGGMQQRICLCITLACNPKIIILDESTTYLDNETKKEILSTIKDIQKNYNLTLIVISHDFKEIYDLCNKIAIMRNGQIVELGERDEIILNPIHPFTIELLLNYLRFYENIPTFTCPLMEIELLKAPSITMISDTHYVRNWYFDERAKKIVLPENIDIYKEKIYEIIRNK